MKLTPTQLRLYELFSCAPDTDRSIVAMFQRTYQGERCDSVRAMQQRLAPIIQRVNAKLPSGHRIEPGRLKQTYRLNTNASV